MDDKEYRTAYCMGIPADVSEDILYELCLQAGPIDEVKRPIDKTNGEVKSFAFVAYKYAESVPYAIHLLDGISLFGRRIKVQNQSREQSENIRDNWRNAGIHSLDPSMRDALVTKKKGDKKQHYRSLSGDFSHHNSNSNMNPSNNHRRGYSTSFSSNSRWNNNGGNSYNQGNRNFVPSMNDLGGPIGSRSNSMNGNHSDYNSQWGPSSISTDLRSRLGGNNQSNESKTSQNSNRLHNLQNQMYNNSGYNNHGNNYPSQHGNNNSNQYKNNYPNQYGGNQQRNNNYGPNRNSYNGGNNSRDGSNNGRKNNRYHPGYYQR